MKIGFPNHPRKDLLEEIEWIGRNGFDFIDLFLEEDKAVPEKIDIKKTKALLRKYKLDVVGHMAWYLPIGSPVKAFRDAAVSEAERYLKVFSELGAKFATIHANWPPISIFSVKEGIAFQIESLKRLVEIAKNYNITILYEPIATDNDSIEAVSEILKNVQELFLHIDIGHSNLSGRKPEQFIKKFYKKIRHVHIHDNDGNSDQHLPIGTGKINWKKMIKILKKYYDGTITLEIFSNDRDYVLLSANKLKEMWR